MNSVSDDGTGRYDITTASGTVHLIDLDARTVQRRPDITAKQDDVPTAKLRRSGPETNYSQPWLEQWGLPEQTTAVTAPTMTTSADKTVALGDGATDTATITGATLGAPANLTWKAYLQPAPTTATDGVTTTAPATCTAANIAFDSTDSPVAVTDAGVYTLPDPAQFTTLGTYLWVATLAESDGTVIAQGGCGDTGETTTVAPFTIATVATATLTAGGSAHDIATVVGPTPSGATLKFAAYKQTNSTATCDASNLSYQGGSFTLNGAGAYPSADTVLPAGKTYFWVATAYDRTGNVIFAGVCGDPNEVTAVASVPPAAKILAYTGVSGPWDGLALFGILAGLGLLALVFAPRRRGRHRASKLFWTPAAA
jgi:hypothetical protein